MSSADADPSLVLPKEPVRPQRTLINPFKPNQIPCNRTCNKHRWSQVFATGPDGEILHRHYHKLAPANDEAEKTEKPEKVSVLWNSRGWFKYMIRFWAGEKLEYPKENYWVDVVHAQYSCIMNFSLLRAGVTGCQSERTPFAAVRVLVLSSATETLCDVYTKRRESHRTYAVDYALWRLLELNPRTAAVAGGAVGERFLWHTARGYPSGYWTS